MSTTVAEMLRGAGIDPEALPALIGVRKAAQTASVSLSTMYNLLTRGKIKYFRLGSTLRVDTRSLLAFITNAEQ